MYSGSKGATIPGNGQFKVGAHHGGNLSSKNNIQALWTVQKRDANTPTATDRFSITQAS